MPSNSAEFLKYLDVTFDTLGNPITEAPIAYKGDMQNGITTNSITSRVISLYWEFRGRLTHQGKDYDVFCLEDTYILGRFDEDKITIGKTKFDVICEISLRKETVLGKPHYAVQSVEIVKTLRGRGIAKAMYKFLSKNENLRIMSDYVQFDGARRLWTSISIDSVVDVYDGAQDKIIHKNYIISPDYKGIMDGVWSSGDNLDFSKANIRFILKSIL